MVCTEGFEIRRKEIISGEKTIVSKTIIFYKSKMKVIFEITNTFLTIIFLSTWKHLAGKYFIRRYT
jgi:ABC-type iron transport system FetAB permease component